MSSSHLSSVKVKEFLITLFLLRPVVDAYRVGVNHEDREATIDTISEMVFNKVRNLLWHEDLLRLLAGGGAGRRRGSQEIIIVDPDR